MSDRAVRVHLQAPGPLTSLPPAEEFAAQVVKGLRSEQHCHNPVVLHNGEGAALVEFLAPSKHVPEVLKRLWALGVTRPNCPYESRLSMATVLVSVPPLRAGEGARLSRPLSRRSLAPTSNPFAGTVLKHDWESRGRCSIDEILTNVDSESHLTFEYLALTICAAIIAGVGLVTDSPVVVVSSMLISPLMKPIMCTALALAMSDWSAAWHGLRNEIIGCVLAFAVGLLAGCGLGPLITSTNFGGEWVLHSNEILSRGDPVALIAGTVLAAPSGVALTLCITGGTSAALVGVAISSSLLPPLVNSGICVTLALASKLLWHHPLQTATEEADPAVLFRYAAVSVGMYLLNLFTVILFSVLTFRFKQVSTHAIDYRAEVYDSSTRNAPQTTERTTLGANSTTETEKPLGYGTVGSTGKNVTNLTKAGV